MRGKRATTEQIIAVLKEVEAGAEPCRQPERPTTRNLNSESFGGRPVTAVVGQTNEFNSVAGCGQ